MEELRKSYETYGDLMDQRRQIDEDIRNTKEDMIHQIVKKGMYHLLDIRLGQVSRILYKCK